MVQDVSPDPASAKAFQLGWLFILLFLEQGRHRQSVEDQITSYAHDLDLNLPDEWRTCASRDPSGGFLCKLLANLEEQIKERSSDAWPYFMSGSTLLHEALADKLDRAIERISLLSLPLRLKQPRADVLAWVNQIHCYFNETIRRSIELAVSQKSWPM